MSFQLDPCDRRRDSEDHGGILILLAVCIFALLSAVALSLDSYRLYTFKLQLRSNVSLAALAAVEAYTLSPSLTFEQRRQVALAKAESSLRGNSYIGYEGKEAMLPNSLAAHGQLVLGNWLITTACLEAGAELDNCFDPMEDFLETNAVRLTVHSLPDQRPKGLISSMIGFRTFNQMSATAIAIYDDERMSKGEFPYLVVYLD